MKAPLIIILATPLLLAQEGNYQTKLGTGTLEFLGGAIRTSGNGHAYTAYATRLSAGLNRWVSAYGEFAYSRLISDYTYIIRPVAGPSSIVAPSEVPAF